jgi:hypothetical protein
MLYGNCKTRQLERLAEHGNQIPQLSSDARTISEGFSPKQKQLAGLCSKQQICNLNLNSAAARMMKQQTCSYQEDEASDRFAT